MSRINASFSAFLSQERSDCGCVEGHDLELAVDKLHGDHHGRTALCAQGASLHRYSHGRSPNDGPCLLANGR